MKKLSIILLFAVIFASCKTKKTITDADAKIKVISAKKVARKHLAASFDKKTIDAKLKGKFDNGKTKQSFNLSMRIVKDEVIWLKGSWIITVFKAKITPTSVRYYSPVFKNYYEGDFSSLEKLLGVEINFEQLQNLFLGQSLQDVKKEKQTVVIKENSYVLSPKRQALLFDIFFAVNPSHYKLDRQSIVNSSKKQRLDVLYSNYQTIDNEIFPSKIKIKAKQKTSFTNLDLTFKSVKFNTAVNTSFKIPSNYKRIKL
jgi:hypothetical protein